MIINELRCGKALGENKLRGEKNVMPEEEKTFRQLGGDVPDRLIADFDEMVNRLGFVKKRALAAAVAAMIRMDLDTQHHWYREVYERYYSDDSTLADAERAAHDAVKRGQPRGRKQKEAG